jgi:hypothetical protein
VLESERRGAKPREKFDGTREEREGLQARPAMLADGESRLRELEESPCWSTSTLSTRIIR